MPKASLSQVAFNGGQLGPRVQGRTDLIRYQTGCNELRNFHLAVQGPAVKRSGTRHVIHAKFDDKVSRLIRFEFSRDQAYVLEFGDLYMRVFRDGGAVLNTAQAITVNPTATDPVVCEITGHLYADDESVFITGSAMTEINDRFFRVKNTTANTFELEDEDGIGRTVAAPVTGTAASVYEIATVYTAGQVFDIQFAQSQDVLFLAHPDVPPQKIERTSDTAWTASEIAFDQRAFRAENITDTTMYASAATGTSVTITASVATFTDDMIGSFIKFSELVASKHSKWEAATNSGLWLHPGFIPGDRAFNELNVYQLVTKNGIVNTGFSAPVHEEGSEIDQNYEWLFINSGSGYAQITAVGSSTPITTCTVNVNTLGVELPESVVLVGNATNKWSLGAWSDEFGYPRAVGFYEDRLFWGGTEKDPQTFWGSRTGRYEDYELRGAEADSGLQFTLASDKINSIEWMTGEDVLFIGTRGGEWTVDSGSSTEAITPSTIRVGRRSNYGSAANVQPVTVDSTILFLHRSARRLYELVFDFQSDQYIAPDITQMSYDIIQSGVVQMAYQGSPFRQVWCVRGDGKLASLTYVRDQEVLGWAPHEVGGTNAKVESIAVVPHADGDEDQLWMLVSRTIGGSTVRYIEFMEKLFESDDEVEDAFFVDSGLTWTNAVFRTDTVSIITAASVTTVTYLADPSTSFAVDDFLVISGVDAVASPEAAAVLNQLEVKVTAVGAFTTTVQDTDGNAIDLSSLPVPGSHTIPFRLDLSTRTITGLQHLEGETVAILADGAVHTSQAVVSGSVTLDSPAVSKVNVGLMMPDARLQTMRLDGGMGALGSAQGRRKRIRQLVVRVDTTGEGLVYGGDFTGKMDSWDLREQADLMDNPVALFTGDSVSLDMPNGWERDGRVAIAHTLPLPCTVVALMPQINTEPR